jgi:patatin-like phospholipase/acyl hydrolase
MTVTEKLAKDGPRKLLALDGGGIRGMLTVEVLAAIEQLLQQELGRGDDFVLADYFDYIGGTSTGAIIATCLALGMRVDRVREFYRTGGREMFDRVSLRQRIRSLGAYRYHDENLAQRIREEVGADTTLGSDTLRTLLMLVLRNATTDSPWPLSNNPGAKYNDRARPDCNLNFPLWQLVRASTAAPTFFPPEVIRVGEKSFIFVDGGVTMYNNPAFQLFLMTTIRPYRLEWPAGQEQMLLVSIGTGTDPNANEALRPDEMNLLYSATSIPAALMAAASYEQDFLCRIFGDCRIGDELDREVGDLLGERGCGPVTPKLFTYLRYNAELSRAGLDRLGLGHIEPEQVQPMDAVEHLDQLQQVGEAVAQRVSRDHFAGFLV